MSPAISMIVSRVSLTRARSAQCLAVIPRSRFAAKEESSSRNSHIQYVRAVPGQRPNLSKFKTKDAREHDEVEKIRRVGMLHMAAFQRSTGGELVIVDKDQR